jgi:hypothetical protein
MDTVVLLLASLLSPFYLKITAAVQEDCFITKLAFGDSLQ